jgi:hypothetical protein
VKRRGSKDPEQSDTQIGWSVRGGFHRGKTKAGKQPGDQSQGEGRDSAARDLLKKDLNRKKNSKITKRLNSSVRAILIKSLKKKPPVKFPPDFGKRLWSKTAIKRAPAPPRSANRNHTGLIGNLLIRTQRYTDISGNRIIMTSNTRPPNPSITGILPQIFLPGYSP